MPLTFLDSFSVPDPPAFYPAPEDVMAGTDLRGSAAQWPRGKTLPPDWAAFTAVAFSITEGERPSAYWSLISGPAVGEGPEGLPAAMMPLQAVKWAIDTASGYTEDDAKDFGWSAADLERWARGLTVFLYAGIAGPFRKQLLEGKELGGPW